MAKVDEVAVDGAVAGEGFRKALVTADKCGFELTHEDQGSGIGRSGMHVDADDEIEKQGHGVVIDQPPGGSQLL